MNEGSEEFPHSIHENDMAKKKSVTVTISSVLTARPFCWLKTYLPEKHGKSDVLTAYKWSVGLWSLLALGLS